MTSFALKLYSIAMWAVQPFLRRKLARRGVAEPGYLENIEERFGQYDVIHDQVNLQNQHFIWIHAVSLGETRAAAVLIAALRESIPNMKLLLTHGTATGRAEGKKLLQAGDMQVWQAWDTVAATKLFIQRFRPQIGIMIETELWPNMASTCATYKVPLVIANARMSEKTFLKTAKFNWLARPAYQSLTAVWPQSDADSKRLSKLGAPVDTMFGNLKFDAKVDNLLLTKGKTWKSNLTRPVIMLASSRQGEEQLFLDVIKTLDTHVQWLIVPRHPQRFDEVATLIVRHGYKVSKRSDWHEKPETPSANTIWLGNSLGEMAMYYGLSDVALLGGSFEPLGGQNLIEAAACACPVMMGPSTFNFALVAEQAINAGAAFRCLNLHQAVNAAVKLINNPIALTTAQVAAQSLAKSHQGVAAKTASAIQQLLR